MMEEGAIEEAVTLEGLDPALPAAKILGLREMWLLRRGEVSEAEAVVSAVTATRQFAKRQMTWFRNRMADWSRLESLDSADNLSTIVAQVA
jgi:tRNA dimethylallyltransferase